MSGFFLRRSPVLLRTLQQKQGHSLVNHQVSQCHLLPRSHNQNRHYFGKFFNFPRNVRECYDFIPSALSFSAAASWFKVGPVEWYLGMVKSRPVFTKSVTCALIYLTADLSSQMISKEEADSYDIERMLRMAGYGMVILGPSLHYWFNLVSRLFPKRDLVSTVMKMVMGQTIYGPIVTVIFFYMNSMLQGESGEEIIARLKRDLVPTLVSGIIYWPMCDFITFKFIPIHLQPLISNLFAYLWTVYLSYMASLEKVEIASC
ncbi:hypothetical protein SAY86_018882 [Trapa natans]|uniref:Uncharacterized protein n=1 Tax=Trapa natans TaxID=22666 RepID=A0AAN7LHQ7_TRANT|nr:hypothetical protein SAY86_018882 [Trapa natans]